MFSMGCCRQRSRDAAELHGANGIGWCRRRRIPPPSETKQISSFDGASDGVVGHSECEEPPSGDDLVEVTGRCHGSDRRHSGGSPRGPEAIPWTSACDRPECGAESAPVLRKNRGAEYENCVLGTFFLHTGGAGWQVRRRCARSMPASRWHHQPGCA